jgi:hypothetical protein
MVAGRWKNTTELGYVFGEISKVVVTHDLPGRYGEASTAGGSRDQGGPVVDVVLVVLVVVVQPDWAVMVSDVGKLAQRLLF